MLLVATLLATVAVFTVPDLKYWKVTTLLVPEGVADVVLRVAPLTVKSTPGTCSTPPITNLVA